MEKLETILASINFSIKDWIIAITLFILIFCILEIRKLKKSIEQEIHKRILPELVLEFISDKYAQDSGFYLKNESFFLARDIQIEDTELILDDFGYKVNFVLKFEGIDYIKPQEKVQLKFKVCDRNQILRPDITERIIPHLTAASFKVGIRYSNIENLRLYVIFSKKEGKIYTEDINFCNKPKVVNERIYR